MYLVLLGYVLGLFTAFAIYLHKTKKVHFAWYQWILIALALIIFMYMIDKYVSFEYQVVSQTFGYTAKMFFIPFAIILILIFSIPSYLRHRKKERKGEE